jgi:hypothetical protein
MQEPTLEELERAQSVLRSLLEMPSRRAAWELAALMRKREGHAFEHGVIAGRRCPNGQIINPYNGEATSAREPEPRHVNFGPFGNSEW